VSAGTVETRHAVVPCPPWCEVGEGHAYELEDPPGVGREHVAYLRGAAPDDKVMIAAFAHAAHNGATEERVDVPLIDVMIEGAERDFHIDDLTADRARELAHFLPGALLAAADRLDRITAV
jgi:hypothetical protein